MIQLLHRSIVTGKWDCLVMWRAITGREGATFQGAPAHVVARWARKDRAGFEGHPEIQDAIGYAHGELRARGLAGGLEPHGRAVPAGLQVQAAGARLSFARPGSRPGNKKAPRGA